MVVLDVDHPDVEAFIETKVKEEEKIRALRDAGFDMDLGGDDIASVQYQNANNSVRVNAEFMTAYENGEKFGLRARMTGEVIEEVDARALFRKLAEAAWACADPGIQYDDVINHWHTTPETGRITASNPCSEYMHLDNSSCNLASLNLMKFLEDDGNGTQRFDAVRFAKVVELVITAMDISISFADFPTQKIGETTRAFRQLGIGYANLGALLMATGHAYDSDGGRALMRRHHLADDRHVVPALRRAGSGCRRVRRVRPQRHRPQPRHEAALRRQRRRRPHGRPGQPGVGRGHRGMAGRPASR